MKSAICVLFLAVALLSMTSAPASAELISGFIGLTALLNGVGTGIVGFGSSATLFGISAGAFGGAIVGGAISKGIRFGGQRDRS